MSKGQYSVKRIAAIAIIASAAVLPVSSVFAEDAVTGGDQSAVVLGTTALQSGAYADAVAQFTAALQNEQLTPETAAVTYLNRGLAYQQLDRYVEAISDYDYALQQNVLTPPVRAVALYNRGLAHRKLYRTTLALEDFTNALILNPGFAQAYNSRGNVLRELGYYSTALDDYDAAIRNEHPQLHIPLYGKALAHAALDDVSGAQRALARALVINPDYEAARVLLARLTATPQSQTDETVIANGADAIETGSVDESQHAQLSRTPPPFSDEATQGRSDMASLSPNEVVASPAGGGAESLEVAANDTGQTQAFVPGPGLESEEVLRSNSDERGGRADNLTTASIDPEETDQTEATAQTQQIPDGWMVQLTAQRTEAAARDVWNRVAGDNSDILSDVTPYIIEADLGSRGVFYRLRAGSYERRSEGERLCRQLQRRGVDCYVVASGS